LRNAIRTAAFIICPAFVESAGIASGFTLLVKSGQIICRKQFAAFA